MILFPIFGNSMNLFEVNSEKLNEICRRHSVAKLFAFGSAVSGKFHEKSDLDFAVLFDSSLSPLAHGDAFFGLQDDLEELFNRPIDLISYRMLKNPIFKSEIDQTKVTLYAA
jgi:hypothetical protein